MRPQSIAVLGGTGFLGTRLVARLIKDGRRVTVLSRRGNTPQALPPAEPAPWQPGDLLDGWKLEQLLGRGVQVATSTNDSDMLVGATPASPG